MQPSFHTIAIDDEHDLHLAEAGEGPAILLIHGAITTSHDWLSGPFARLAELGHVIAVDRPGHGRSRRGRFEGSPHAQAKAIGQALARRGIGKAVVVGHSFGGLVALAYAQAFPEMVGGLILLAPIVLPELRPAEQMLYAPRAVPVVGPMLSEGLAGSLDRTALTLMHKLMFAPAAVSPDWEGSYPWNWMLTGAAGVANGEDAAAIHPLSPVGLIDWSRITMPVHVLHGSADMVVQHQRQGGPMTLLLPQARLDVLDGAGHMIHHTHGDAVVEVVRAALQG